MCFGVLCRLPDGLDSNGTLGDVRLLDTSRAIEMCLGAVVLIKSRLSCERLLAASRRREKPLARGKEGTVASRTQ